MSEPSTDHSTAIAAAKIGLIGTIVAAIITVGLPALLSRAPTPQPPPSTVRPGSAGETTTIPATYAPTVTPDTPSPVTLADWRRDANAICDGAFANLRALGGPVQTWDEYVSKGIAAIGITRSMADQVRSLNAPPTEAVEVGEWIGHLDDMVLAHSRAVDAAQRGDQGAVAEASTELSGALERANEAARVLGLDCIFVNQ